MVRIEYMMTCKICYKILRVNSVWKLIVNSVVKKLNISSIFPGIIDNTSLIWKNYFGHIWLFYFSRLFYLFILPKSSQGSKNLQKLLILI